ncbi:hypothetical protein EVAR_69988_1 [Eumeta japonica]|uniref:Uncharacterized protein n=1 Tax=Eumeta variegata TaxID=151549 RepID=A0A4C1ZGJ2_EUMVA|nr:hypothetical protein EVAR_69988_1 [Eumeta japonica]
MRQIRPTVGVATRRQPQMTVPPFDHSARRCPISLARIPIVYTLLFITVHEPSVSNSAATSKNRPARPVKNHTLVECRCEVAASAVTFHPVSESSGGPGPCPSSARYSNSCQEVKHTAVTPLELQASLSGGDHPFSDDSPTRLLLRYAIKNVIQIKNTNFLPRKIHTQRRLSITVVSSLQLKSKSSLDLRKGLKVKAFTGQLKE